MIKFDRLSIAFKDHISNPLLNFVFPAICAVCENTLEQNERIICRNCISNLTPLNEKYIQSLLKEIENPQFENLFVLFEFDKVFQVMIHLLKYQRYMSLATLFADRINLHVPHKYSLILGVPLNPIRQKERGYNQSAQIAEHLARRLDSNFSETILERPINTPSQTKLNRSERIKNMQGAFRCTAKLQGQKVLLVDDVITTGSTLNSCAAVLKDAGASIVDVVGLATPVGFFQKNLERNKPGSEVFNKSV